MNQANSFFFSRFAAPVVVLILAATSCPLLLAAEERPDAADIVRAAHAAAGGEAWRRPRSLELSGIATFYRDGRNSAATSVDDYHMWRVFPDESTEAHSANGMVRFDARSRGRIVFQTSFDGESSYDQNGRVEDAAGAEQWRSNFGFGIIRFALDEGFTVSRLADDTVDGHQCYFIEVLDPAGGRTLFGIDTGSYYVRMVGFSTPRGWHHRVYDDFEWHENPRFLQPTSVRLYYDGRKTADITWQDYRVNRRIEPSLFTLTADARRGDDR